MPKGPQGQKRPADAIARAVMVAKIATGEMADPQKEDTVCLAPALTHAPLVGYRPRLREKNRT
jgi:hypothetical protein